MLRKHHQRRFTKSGRPMRRFRDYEEGDTFTIGRATFFKCGKMAEPVDPKWPHIAVCPNSNQWLCEY